MAIVLTDEQANQSQMKPLDRPWRRAVVYLEGQEDERPLGAHVNTVFIAQDTGRAWMWFHPVWNTGRLSSRPTKMRLDGVCYWADDVDEVYMWIQ
jgi:hypothetical protein